MRDAAAAAAMSDPMLNRWFRRRWAEQEGAGLRLPAPVIQDDEQIDLVLAWPAEWRRGRADPNTVFP